MSILIKGMEMPDRCSRCDATFPDGVGWSCPLIKGRPNIDNQKGRRKDCPLVPVPPHGRLIDADAMIEECHGHNSQRTMWGEIEYLIDNTPTIIPADPAEEGK